MQVDQFFKLIIDTFGVVFFVCAILGYIAAFIALAIVCSKLLKGKG